MSHFSVAVFSTDGDYEKLLAPFNENLEVEANEEGALMTTYNPNSKWDWYVVGGRWSGMLIVKDDAEGERGSLGVFGYDREKEIPAPPGYRYVDHAKVSDIEWDVMREVELQERKMIWKQYMDEYAEKVLYAKTEEEKESERRWLCMKYGIPFDATEEKYLANSTGFTTFAVITPDGEWHERGAMGWFGVVQGEDEEWDEKYKERFLDTADPDWYLTVIDCHI